MKAPERTAPPAQSGDRVIVREQNISPWQGVVTAVKWSSVSGWWAQVRREDDAATWYVSLALTDVEIEVRDGS